MPHSAAAEPHLAADEIPPQRPPDFCSLTTGGGTGIDSNDYMNQTQVCGMIVLKLHYGYSLLYAFSGDFPVAYRFSPD